MDSLGVVFRVIPTTPRADDTSGPAPEIKSVETGIHLTFIQMTVNTFADIIYVKNNYKKVIRGFLGLKASGIIIIG
jgi:hypothetical protein